MQKRPILCIAGVGIIYSQSNPRCILAETKTPGYPMEAFVGAVSLIGGNWLGDNARKDENPLDTFRREVGEELSPGRSAEGDELVMLGHAETPNVAVARDRTMSTRGQEALFDLKKTICTNAVPFGDFIDTISPAYRKQGGYDFLASCWAVPLDYKEWMTLMRLQDAFRNLSNESATVITSLDEMINKGQKSAFGYDRLLQRFWLAMGLTQARDLPMMEGNDCQPVGTAMATYEDYLAVYDVAKKP